MKHVAFFALIFSASAFADWSYHAPTGPAQWGQLPGFSTCASGFEQSPVAIETGEIADFRNAFPDGALEPLTPQWSETPVTVLNNGRTIQAQCAAGSALEFDGARYELKQFHFHSPSEHSLNERQYPLEAHFVHQTSQGQLLVVGVFFRVGAENAELAKVWRSAPARAGQTQTSPELVSAARLWPGSGEYFTYAGSLTTPPCSEGVRWIVMRSPVEASAEQVSFLRKLLGFTNNRPLQGLEGRMISIGDAS